jgi:DNA-binding IclR family transcriptional regulator
MEKRRNPSRLPPASPAAPAPPSAQAGTQTLLRGLAVLQAVAEGARDLKSVAAALGTSRSTTHRLLSVLAHERYLRHAPQGGYLLGPRLVELGYQAREAIPLPALARPLLEGLARLTGDTVHLASRDGDEVLYLDKLPGTRGLEMRSRIGHRMPLLATGVGKALLLDESETEWRRLYAQDHRGRDAHAGWEGLLKRMRQYAEGGYAYDLEDNEASIRCIAAPIRDAGGAIVAAVSVASMASYMPLRRMKELIAPVKEAAARISAELGAPPG